jgi:hypothetical protein
MLKGQRVKTRKTRKTRKIIHNNKNNKKNINNKSNKMKGGTINPFSDFFGIFNTMSYNLSNALSTFAIKPPPAYMNSSQNPVNPSFAKQFLSSEQ